jgi:hypothetical protein
MLLRTFFLAAVVTYLAPLGAVRAQGTDAASAVAARASFSEGVALSDAGRWHDAVAPFREALALRDSSVVAFNLGLALSHDGHPVEAAELFRRVIRSDGTDVVLRGDATQQLAIVDPRIAWAVIAYSGGLERAVLHVDGEQRPIVLLGGLPLDPGAHEITLTRDDDVIGRRSFVIAAGAHDDIALEAIDVAPRPEVVAPAHAESLAPSVVASLAPLPARSDDAPIWIGVGVGAGVAIAVGAIVLAVVLVPSSEAMPYPGSLPTVEVGR